MLLTIVLTTFTLVHGYDLEGALKSPGSVLRLYRTFKKDHHVEFPESEDRLRFRVFRENVALVSGLNRAAAASGGSPTGTAIFTLNKFSSMTLEEKIQYEGLNMTGRATNPEDDVLRAAQNVPGTVLWTEKGGVTVVKDQGRCGSCWTFGAIGSLETHYQKESGVLRRFSEQELLDCVFEGWRDGCRGGWLPICYEYAANTSRLASAADYPYVAKDGKCDTSGKADALVAYKITGHVDVPKSEAANIEALAKGSLAMAIEVTDLFRQYGGGILIDTTCRGRVSHAVIGVGYTPTYILIKNSWGKSWGENGYIRFSRNLGIWSCGLFNYSVYPTLVATGNNDSGSDPSTDYKAPTECEDAPNKVPNYCQIYKSHCWHLPIALKCMKTCGKC